MKKIKKHIQTFFEFSHTEIRGFFVLFIIMVLALLTPFLLDFFQQPSTLTFEQEQKTLDSLVAVLEEQKQIIHDIKPVQKEVVKEETKKEKSIKKVISYPVLVKKIEKIKRFEINQADTIQLRQIRGIGEKLSQRIIKYRNKLGGFHTQNQLYEVYGLDSVVINRLLRYSTIDTSLVIKQQINQPLDKVFFKELLKHPYLKYEDVKAIFKHHREQGVFQTKKQLIQVLGVKKANKLYTYIDFSY